MTHADVTLRNLIISDKEHLASLANNKKIFDNVRDHFPHPYTVSDAENFIRTTEKQEPALSFAIVYKEDFTGVISLMPRSDVYRKTAEVGYWLGEPFWSKGIATAALRWIGDYAFNTLEFSRIEAAIFEYNKASQKVLEKCGFTMEGIAKNAVFKNGQLWNEVRFGKVK